MLPRPQKKQNNVPRPPGQGKSRSARRRRARRARAAGNGPALSVGFQGPLKQPRQETATGASLFTKRYAAVLDDPFTNEPIKLGFGTLVDTTLGVARVTTTLTANADGSLVIVGKCSANAPISYQAGAAGANPKTGTAWASVQDSGWTTASTTYSVVRPVALGLKVTPIISANDAITRVVSMCIPYNAEDDPSGGILNGLNSNTQNTWFTSHLGSKTILCAGSSTVQTWRPMDISSFEFDQGFFDAVPANANNAVFPQIGPALVCAISGAASKQYDVEVIYYYEALAAVGSILQGTNPMTDQRASDFFPSLEKFYTAASTYLNPDNVGRVASAASAASTMWRRYTAGDRLIPYVPHLQRIVSEEKEEEESPPTSARLSRPRTLVK